MVERKCEVTGRIEGGVIGKVKRRNEEVSDVIIF